ncbi:MAG: hypothetical protein IKH01_08220 [Prevotella sp.]|nr:hypothetical protein [Prevotella sp.]
MKTKKTIITFLALFACILGISAENSVVVNDALVTKGKTSSFNIELINPDDAFCAFQMDVVLPDGLTYVSASKGGRMTSAHSLGSSNMGGNVIRFSSIDTELNRNYLGESGTLFTITVSVSDGVTVGDNLAAQLQNVEFARKNESMFKIAQQDFSIEVTDRVVIDENSAALPIAQNGVNVLVKRTIKKDVWNTIYLPFKMTQAQAKSVFGDDVQIAAFASLESNEEGLITLNFTQRTATNAFITSQPFLIKTTEDISEFTVDNVNIELNNNPKKDISVYDEDEDDDIIVGTFYGTTSAGTVLNKDLVFLNSNKFYYSTGSTIIKGLRGYFWLKDFDSFAGAPSLIMAYDGTPTNVNHVKVVVNEDGMCYNLKGQRVENPTEKGIYIRNGKKFVIK